MSKKCKNCGAELPDEANFCLECMTVFDNLTDKNEIAAADITGRSSLLPIFGKFKEKLLMLSKKQRAALISALALFLLLVPLSVFMLSPVEPSGNIAGGAASGSTGDDKPVTRVEALFDEVFGTENENSSNDTENTSDGTAESNAASSGANGVSQKAENVGGSTTNAQPGKGNTSSVTDSAGSGSTANSNNSSNSNSVSSAPVLNYADWEYESDGDSIVITRYTGNDKNIIVPDKIDGKNVGRISSGTFKDNNTLETVAFKDSEDYHSLWIENLTFENCDSLNKIAFPENTNLGIYEEFFLNCPELAELEINFNQFRYIEGALYSYNGAQWSLRAYCARATRRQLTPCLHGAKI